MLMRPKRSNLNLRETTDEESNTIGQPSKRRKRRTGKEKETEVNIRPWDNNVGPIARPTEEARHALEKDPAIVWLKEQYANGWRRYLPSLSEMPKGWPGLASYDGQRAEHLTPDYWTSYMYKGPRDHNGLLNGLIPRKPSSTDVGRHDPFESQEDAVDPGLLSLGDYPQYDDDDPQHVLDGDGDPQCDLDGDPQCDPDGDVDMHELLDKETKTTDASPPPQLRLFTPPSNHSPIPNSGNGPIDDLPATPKRSKFPGDQASSSEDIPSVKISKPSTHNRLTVPKKKTAYLITPTRTRRRVLSPTPSSPPCSLRLRKHQLTHLPADANRVFFTTLASLLDHVDHKGGKVNFDKINKQIRTFADYDLYPHIGFLKGLLESREKDDIILIKHTKRVLTLLAEHLKSEDDYKGVANHQVDHDKIQKFSKICNSFLLHIKNN